MSKALSILSFLWGRRSLWVTVFFVVVVGFFDENSILNLLKLKQDNARLRSEIAYFEEEYNNSNAQLQRLEKSQEAIEEVARVTLRMKTNDEDIYIVEEGNKE